jgi:putative DNA primase/helicase
MEPTSPGRHPKPDVDELNATAKTLARHAADQQLADYLDTCLGDTQGRLHIGIGYGGHFTDAGKYEFDQFVGSHFAWPGEADQAVRELLAAATVSDVYVCPYLMHADKRTPAAAVARDHVHADIDHGGLDLEKVRALDGSAVASGTPGNGHVYVALTESVPAHWHKVLCRGLADYLGGGDAKISANDLLRPPGTFNHKPAAKGGAPTPVEWRVRPPGVSADPRALARLLGVALPGELRAVQKVAGSTASATIEQFNIDEHPLVKAALQQVTDDRSVDTMRVARACRDSDLTLAQARYAVNARADLVARLAERHDDDVAECWRKMHDTDGGDIIKHSGHLGMAVKLGQQFNRKLLYVNGIGWHRWDGKRYARDDTGAARRAVHAVLRRDRRTVERLNLPAEEQEDRLKAIARYETASAISGILTEAAALSVFSVTVADIDADPWLFNCANGTLDLHTLQLRGHDPADRITKVANAAYHRDIVGTVWAGFLQTVLPDEPVRKFLQRLTGLGLLGEVNGAKQIAPIATGRGANGKTTFVEAATFALGDYAMTAEPTLLMAKRGDTHPTGVADLLGKRFVTTVETEQGRRFDITLLKWLTGGDTLKARYMRQNFFSFEPTHLLLLATNHLPRIDDDTEAVWRRIRVIPFTVEIPEEDRDEHLGDKLHAEADAVLTWIVDGWKDYRERGGLDAPDAVKVATGDYKAESDAVGRFITDECVTGAAHLFKSRTKPLYQRWEQWARTDGCPQMSQIAFGRALENKGYPAEKDTREGFRRGIALKPEPHAGSDSWHTGF